MVLPDCGEEGGSQGLVLPGCGEEGRSQGLVLPGCGKEGRSLLSVLPGRGEEGRERLEGATGRMGWRRRLPGSGELWGVLRREGERPAPLSGVPAGEA